MNKIAVGLSIIFSFVLSEFFGLAGGGMISAGYLALYTDSPLRLVSTVICAFAVYFSVLGIKKIAIIYGKRRFALCVLVGLIFSWIWTKIIPVSGIVSDVRIIGFIIPGLIANDMLKQGILRTLLSLALITLAVKLILLLEVAL